MPKGVGTSNSAGLDFYDRLVDTLLRHGVQPVPTLYHWDLPQALEDRGGWPERFTVDAFAEYADIVVRRLGDRVPRWITINEPSVFCFSGYFSGRHAPGRHSLPDALQAAHHALLAHGRAVEVIRANSNDARVGISLSLGLAYPVSSTDADRRAARLCDGYHNRWFLDPLYGRGYPEDMLRWYGSASPSVLEGDFDVIAGSTDFLGVNAYCPDYVRAAPDSPFGHAALTGDRDALADMGMQTTSLGWPIVPEALHELLVRVHEDYSPPAVTITENGCAGDDQRVGNEVDDQHRIDYLSGHIDAVLRARSVGIPVDGYFAWSLMDNFEWAAGYRPRFGLVYTDYDNALSRVPKRSYYWYQQFIRRHAGAV
jgi:beta-glucosidase